MTAIVEPRVELIAHRSQGEEAEEEVWKPIAGYEGLYEVSNQGRVRSLDRVVLRKNGQSQLCRGRLLKPYKKKKVAKDGGHYETLFLSRDGIARQFYVHHIVLGAFAGERGEHECARHLNDNPSDNRASNLVWGSLSENQIDRIRNGNNEKVLQTHCKRGHQLSPPNLVKEPEGVTGRRCLACKRALDLTKRDKSRRAVMQELSDKYYEKIMREN